ncbi:MAG TPA: glycoside hydrolase family 172 protein, partial [Candidatus Acidoferrum sp.]|nr:glycoside hydrolase family 172 protein [Candidatus Acidoferrum sp.]
SAKACLALPIWFAIWIVTPLPCPAEITLDSLLREMTDYNTVARWPSPSFTLHQCSSYDRTKVAPDKPGWFSNHDFSQYIREENYDRHTEQVMMDADGPGCIVRFWLTTIQNKKGILRIYLDNQAEPAISFPSYDLLSSDLNLRGPLDQPHPGYSPSDNGGNTLMLPIPYAKHCKVTWEEAGEGPRYYQINYRTYVPGTKVKTFTREAFDKTRPLIEQTEKKLLSPPDDSKGKESQTQGTIAAGISETLDLPPGPAAVRQLELQVGSTNLEQTLRSLILKMDFDGEQTVWCPVTDFFGSGVGINSLQSWYRTVNADGSMVCRWSMPYAKSARVSLLNLGNQPISFSLKAYSGHWKWDKRSMHFHSVWHYDADLTTPPARDWNAIHITGHGTYIGDTLALFNYVPTWYGEGDEKIWIDGESFPSLLGTGMEDYYDFSFAPRGLMQTPFANQVRVDQPMTQGNNVLTRTRNLDGIPFEKSLDFNFELIAWQPTRLNYAMTTYWYALPGTSSNIHPQPDAATRVVPTLADVQKQQPH